MHFEKRSPRQRQTTLRNRARQMRGEMPLAERILWSRLRNDQINGLRFRRQHPVGKFILDFYCAAMTLVIECDGETHDDKPGYDQSRDEYLRARGLHVMRFSNHDVISNCDGVLATILEFVESKKNPLPRPLPEYRERE